MKKTSIIASLVLLTLSAVPAHADTYLVFRKKGQRYPETTSEIWKGPKPPIPGKNVPADALVIPLPKGKDPRKMIRISERLEDAPPPPVVARERTPTKKETLRTSAADAKMTDEEWIKQLRNSYKEEE